MQAVPRLSERVPDEADPRVLAIDEDLKQSLSVPFANFISSGPRQSAGLLGVQLEVRLRVLEPAIPP